MEQEKWERGITIIFPSSIDVLTELLLGLRAPKLRKKRLLGLFVRLIGIAGREGGTTVS